MSNATLSAWCTIVCLCAGPSCGGNDAEERDAYEDDGTTDAALEEETREADAFDATDGDAADEGGPRDAAADEREEAGGEEPGPGTLLGEVELTYYWVAYEGDHECTSPDTTIGTCAGEAIAVVCREFAEAARMEGTAKLEDGRMINIGGCSCSGGFDCFTVLDPEEFPWGMGNRSNPLEPFVSVAVDVDVIPSGTVLYSPEIDGTPLPEDAGGGVHDGCLRADDVGGGIIGMHIDFFAALRIWYGELDPLIPDTVTLYTDPPRCSL